ncbi:VapE domain-containing protein [Nioella ostreopsis]|uniref:VapE domain-containing protein n=1 Tax=Nioella ostreopsis TaxID=2448479 RepID=UPI000FDB8993|nr:VapE domain-containing protein [Nioella ostreopsis]
MMTSVSSAAVCSGQIRDPDPQKSLIDNTTLKIAVGKGKGLGRIANERWSVKKLIRKLSEPLEDTSITFAQYQALKMKAAKGDKDANDRLLRHKRMPGNYTTAVYSGNARKKTDLLGKSAVVLDIDHANHEQIAAIRAGLTPVSKWAWFMHTSRSHYPEKPKVRLIVWVNRLMTLDESHAIHRLVATFLLDEPGESIEIVDLVSFRANQTMFWPSISKGQEFFTEENVAPVLDVDEFLAGHPEWSNVLALPHQEDEKVRNGDPNATMADPREKPNPIGAFCRAYTVEDVIEKWLSETYIPGDSETEIRYTYAPGTASNGAVVYEDGLFLHSNHGSDPLDGSANAWDLLRVHKFGHLDDDTKEDMSPSQFPSYKAMVKLAQADPDVASAQFAGLDDVLDELDDEDEDDAEGQGGDDLADLIGEVPDDLDDLIGEPSAKKKDKPEKKKDKAEKSNEGWQANFLRKANGDLTPALNNITLICQNDRRIAPSVRFNDFTKDPVCMKPIRAPKMQLPSPTVSPKDRKHGRKWDENDDIAITLIASGNAARGGYETEFSKQNVQAAVMAAAVLNPIHPVKDFLEEHHAEWKRRGSPRGIAERVSVDYLKTPDTPFHRQSMLLYLVAAVARIYEPGCKFDQIFIIEGPEGSRKSSFFKVLHGGFAAELDCDLEDTGRFVEATRGRWCLEMAEMRAAKAADSETLKRMLSTASDTHRLAYAAREMTFDRQFVVGGTSNLDNYLSDPTSNRRYWIHRTPLTRFNPIDTDLLHENLWAIWGEAMQVYLDMRAEQPTGELRLDLTDREVILEQAAIAEGSRKLTNTEELAFVIQDWLEKPFPANEVMVDEDGLVLDEYADDTTPMLRNMFTAAMAWEAVSHNPAASHIREGAKLTGRAIKLIPGVTVLPRGRHHGSNLVWAFRFEEGPLWVPAEGRAGAPDDDLDDLI